jgi:hypothetical protein
MKKKNDTCTPPTGGHIIRAHLLCLYITHIYTYEILVFYFVFVVESRKKNLLHESPCQKQQRHFIYHQYFIWLVIVEIHSSFSLINISSFYLETKGGKRTKIYSL